MTAGAAMLVLEDGRTFRGDAYGAVGETVRRGGLQHRHDRLPGDADRPVLPPAGRRHDGAAHRQHRRQRRGRRSPAGSGSPATSCATRPGVPSNWRPPAPSTTSWSAQGVVGISGIDTRALTRHLRERGAMRVGIFSGDDRPGRAVASGCWRSPEMAGADLAGEVTTAQPYVVPAVGENRFTVAALDLGIKAMTPHRMAERGIEVHVLPGHRRPVEDVLAGAPTASSSPTAPATRPPPTDGPVALLRRRSWPPACPFFGICFGNQILGRALGFGTYKLELRPPRHQPAGAGPRHRARSRSPRTTTASPSTRRSTGSPVDTPYGRGRGQPRLPQRRRRRGAALPRRAGVLGAVPPRRRRPGPHDAAYLFDRFGADLMTDASPARPDAEGADASPRHRAQRPGHRLRADRHRPGLRVRLLRHPGLPGAAGRGPAGHPGQLQPGDDHDRPGVRRRHLHRADHARVRREGHRQGAPRRAAGRPWAARPRSTPRWPCTRPASWRSTASS